MPTSARVLLASAVVAFMLLLALSLPGTAEAGVTPSAAAASADESPTPQPTCTTPLDCVIPTRPAPTATPTQSPTPSPTASPAPRVTLTATPTPRRTRSPEPRSTFSVAPGSTENPITATFDVGGVTPESATPTLSPATSSSSSNHGSDTLTRLLYLVLGGAVLLGVSGATGLYLTRHRP